MASISHLIRGFSKRGDIEWISYIGVIGSYLVGSPFSQWRHGNVMNQRRLTKELKQNVKDEFWIRWSLSWGCLFWCELLSIRWKIWLFGNVNIGMYWCNSIHWIYFFFVSISFYTFLSYFETSQSQIDDCTVNFNLFLKLKRWLEILNQYVWWWCRISINQSHLYKWNDILVFVFVVYLSTFFECHWKYFWR
jgi:hypothetical protein